MEFRETDEISPDIVNMYVSKQIQKIIFHLKEKKKNNYGHNC